MRIKKLKRRNVNVVTDLHPFLVMIAHLADQQSPSRHQSLEIHASQTHLHHTFSIECTHCLMFFVYTLIFTHVSFITRHIMNFTPSLVSVSPSTAIHCVTSPIPTIKGKMIQPSFICCNCLNIDSSQCNQINFSLFLPSLDALHCMHLMPFSLNTKHFIFR